MNSFGSMAVFGLLAVPPMTQFDRIDRHRSLAAEDVETTSVVSHTVISKTVPTRGRLAELSEELRRVVMYEDFAADDMIAG